MKQKIHFRIYDEEEIKDYNGRILAESYNHNSDEKTLELTCVTKFAIVKYNEPEIEIGCVKAFTFPFQEFFFNGKNNGEFNLKVYKKRKEQSMDEAILIKNYNCKIIYSVIDENGYTINVNREEINQ